KTARHLSDLLKLIPPNTDRELFQFSVAVENTALATPEGNMLARPTDAPVVLAPAVPAPDSTVTGGSGSGKAGAAGLGAYPPPGTGMPTSGPAGAPKMPARPGEEASKRDGKMKAGDRAEKDSKADPEEMKKLTEGEELYFRDDREKGLPRQLFRKLD